MELSGEFPVKALCEEMGIVRSSFYGWKKRLSHPSEREKSFGILPMATVGSTQRSVLIQGSSCRIRMLTNAVNRRG